jgi:ribonuclease HII
LINLTDLSYVFNEMKKNKPNFSIELDLSLKYQFIAGVDEVGRGSIAGPIVAAAVIFPNYEKIIRKLKGITDSKLLDFKKRKELEGVIRKYAADFAIGEVSAKEIDTLGIGAANILAFKKALDGLKDCDFSIIDGRKFRGFDYPYRCFEKGELKSISIAAASIVAKVYRDELMVELSKKYDQYGFEKNVGYGGHAHYKAIEEHGPSEIHRRTFLSKFNQRNDQKSLF